MPHLFEALDRLRGDHANPLWRGKAFEKLIRAALLANPQYNRRFRNLWLWNDWPDRPGIDLGIDLVGEQTDEYGGGLCAIQCKFYKGRVSTGDVNKFVANSIKEEWRARIFVATSDYTQHARRTLVEAKVEIITGGDLDTWPVGDWRELITKPDTITLPWGMERHIPRHHQEEALEAIQSGLFGPEGGDLGRVLMPCGSGKSEVGLWAAERNVGLGRRVLYLVPSIALMSQTMRTWANQQNPDIPHRYLAVCSDSKAARDPEDIDLAELAMPVTTKPQAIASELKREAFEAMTVVFSTYQSLPMVCEAQDLGAPIFDLVICDEAHRTTGIEDSSGNEGLFQLVHDRDRLDAHRRLFMTATQRLYASGWKKRAGGEVYSMDDESLYGPILYQQSFRDAINADLLTDYEVVVIAYSEQHQIDTYDKYWKGYQDKNPNLKIPKTQKLNAEDWVNLVGCWDALSDPVSIGLDRQDPAGTLNPYYTCRRAIAFTNTIASSKKVERHWRNICDTYQEERAREYRKPVALLDVEHIDGKQNAFQRAQKVQWLRGLDQPEGTIRVLTNARCLSEGVDIPALDAVLFLAPRQSEIDIVQAVGRVMRKAEGKDKGYIVIPVLVPEGETLYSEEYLRSSNFQQMWKVCRALRAHDERFDALINSPGLAGTIPISVIGPWVEKLPYPEMPGLLPQIASVMVDQVGDRHYWPSWGRNAAGVYQKVVQEVDRKTREGAGKATLDRFTEGMCKTVIPAFERRDAIEMVAQHAVTIPVFDAFFADHSFREENPISRHLNTVLTELQNQAGVNFDQLIQPLKRSYDRIATVFEDVSEDADPDAAKLQILQDVYEGFFKSAIPEVVKRLGIVYTPVPLVDFMLRSAEAAVQKHFGKSLGDPGVEILDPFTGTGTFLSRLLAISGRDGQPLISDDHVAHKYLSEMHAGEMVLLAYYIAALKIEQSASSRGVFDNGYRPFEGIVLRDTFTGSQEGQFDLGNNPARALEQDARTIRVILGNPPWSAGQKDAGDDNPNRRNPHIEERVRETYSKYHRQVTGRAPGGSSGGNLYVQSLRWATDRLGDPTDPDNRQGVVAFIHPNSLATGTALAGMRACLREEFDHLYVINLRGDAYKSGEEFQKEGDKIFGGGSRNGVQITVAVRSPDHNPSSPGSLHYAQVPEYSTLEKKFAWLDRLGDVTGDEFKPVPINDRHDWVNLTDGTFQDLLPVCETHNTPRAIVPAHASGVKTNCDTYVYSFSREKLIDKIKTLIDAYEEARGLRELGEPLEDVTENFQPENIKWTDTLKNSLKKGEPLQFDEARIREVLYRPFTKLWLYEDHRILSSVKTISALFPKPDPTLTHPPPGEQKGSWSISPDRSPSVSSPQTEFPTSAPPDAKPEPSPDSDPDQRNLQHDLPGPGDQHPAGPGHHRRIPSDPSHPEGLSRLSDGGPRR
ncbi:MAG: DEAD/DEAH box helicase, partial [Acidimicrobiia bacterium]|nr:DEAD/DEAH box helicase [Acidimicrobiia bacterium]